MDNNTEINWIIILTIIEKITISNIDVTTLIRYNEQQSIKIIKLFLFNCQDLKKRNFFYSFYYFPLPPYRFYPNGPSWKRIIIKTKAKTKFGISFTLSKLHGNITVCIKIWVLLIPEFDRTGDPVRVKGYWLLNSVKNKFETDKTT